MGLKMLCFAYMSNIPLSAIPNILPLCSSSVIQIVQGKARGNAPKGCCTSIPLSRHLQSTNIPRTGQNKTTLPLGMPLDWVLACFPILGGIIKETIPLVNVLNPFLSRHPCCTYDLCVDGCREKRERSPTFFTKPLVTVSHVWLCLAVGLR